MLGLAAPLTWIAVGLFSHYVVRGSEGARRIALVVCAAACALVAPWYVPADLAELRFIVAMGSFLATMHLLEVAFGRYPDEDMQVSLGRFFFYFLNAPDAHYDGGTPEARLRARALGRRRALRGLAKQVVTLAMLAVSTAAPAIHDHLAAHLFWVVWLMYFAITGVFDLAAGAAMQVGMRLDEIFHLPPLAHSPRDFWSRRWNMAFRNMCHRLVFAPMQARNRTVWAIALVFVISALVHEYLVVAALGTTAGHMTVFFLGHGVAVMLYGYARRRRGRPFIASRSAAVGLHLVWFTASSYFFFTPVLEVFPLHTWRLW